MPTLIKLSDGQNLFTHAAGHPTVPNQVAFTGDGNVLVVGSERQIFGYRNDGTLVWTNAGMLRAVGNHGYFEGLSYYTPKPRGISTKGWVGDGVYISPEDLFCLTVEGNGNHVNINKLDGGSAIQLTGASIEKNRIQISDVAWDEAGNRVAVADVSAVPDYLSDEQGNKILPNSDPDAGFSGIHPLDGGEPVRFCDAQGMPLPEAQQVRWRPNSGEIYVRCASFLIRHTKDDREICFPHGIWLEKDSFALHRASDGVWIRDVANPGMDAVFSADGKRLVGTLGVVDVESGKRLSSFEKLPARKSPMPWNNVKKVVADAAGFWSGRWPSPHGTYIACLAYDGTLTVFRTLDLSEVCRWPPGALLNEPAKPRLVAWRPDETALAVSFDDHVGVALVQLNGINAH